MSVARDSSSPSDFELNSCQFKKRYPTEQVARRVNRKWVRRGGRRMRAYPCTFCKGWHLTKRMAP